MTPVTPREQQGLLHDLFAANTYWELKTKRATVEPAEGEGHGEPLHLRMSPLS